jgi:polyphosphate kinase 2
VTFESFLDEFKDNKEIQENIYRKYTKQVEESNLRPYQVELLKLQSHLERVGAKMIVLVEGRDASGKGGAIRRITRYMNEKHYRIVALGKPSDFQLTQWYFQRYVEQFPHGGEIVLFDRSWYNRAMVEPVFDFCTPKQYDTFMNSVPSFEQDLVEHEIHFVKIYFSVTKEEQSNRFKQRETNPLKRWKLSEIDLQMQEKWDEFTQMKYQMLKKTHTAVSPWTVIRSDNKPKARLNAIKVILNSVDYEDRNMDLNYTLDKDIAHSGEDEIRIMDSDFNSSGKFIG